MESKQKRDEFKLRIAGIGLGNHRFSIACDKAFFEIAGITELEDGFLELDIEMEKKENMLSISFHFDGQVTAPCDRCLDPVTLPLAFDEHLVVNLIPMGENETDGDEIWVLNENEYEIDLFHFVYESIRLALPMQITHSITEDGTSACNPEIVKQLDQLSQKEGLDPEDTDPRWDALKNIKLD